MSSLTPTSYGVLALLAKRPWSAYDLTREIRRSLSQCWPRAETGLYREPKRLVAKGLARARVEQKGRQEKTVYSITAAGRRALRDWYGRPASPPVFESEAVVRTVFAEHGTRDQLVAGLAQLERQVLELAASGFGEIPLYLERVGASDEHMADIALVGRLYVGIYATAIEWARWASDQVKRRPETLPEGSGEAALEALAAAAGELGLIQPGESVHSPN